MGAREGPPQSWSTARNHAADVANLFCAHGVRHRVLVPFDPVAVRLEQGTGLPAPSEGDERILGAVGHEDGDVTIGRARLGRHDVGQGQEAGEGHDARQALSVAQSRLQGHSPSLREAGQDDPRGGNPPSPLARDQRLDAPLRGPDTRLVLTPDTAVVEDVVPGSHNVAAVDGDGLPRRMGEHEADGQRGRQVEFRHHRLEIVAIGAETVHPDNGGPRGGRRLHLDRVELSVTHESTA